MKWEHTVINQLSKDIYLDGHFSKFYKLWQYIPSIIYTCYYKSIASLDRDGAFKEDIVSDCLTEMWTLMRRKWDLLLKCDPSYFYSYYMRTSTLIMKNSLARLSGDYESFYSKDITEIDIGVTFRWEDSLAKRDFFKKVQKDIEIYQLIWENIYHRRPSSKDTALYIYPIIKDKYSKEYCELKEV